MCILLPEITSFVKGNLFINRLAIVLFVLQATFSATQAQQITYSVPLGDNISNTSFDIVGLCNQHLLVCKKSDDDFKMAVYDTRLEIIDEVPLDFLPAETKHEDFVNLGYKVIMFYQYTHRRDIYCGAVTLDENARPVTEPVVLDTTLHPDKIVGDKAYSVIHSQDNSKIMVFEILQDEDSMKFHVRTFLYDSSLNNLGRGEVVVPYIETSDRLSHFTLANDGGLYFLSGIKTYALDPYFQSLSVYFKPGRSGRVIEDTIPLGGLHPKMSVVLKIDELHGRLWIDALCYDRKSRDVHELYSFRYGLRDLRLREHSRIMLTDSLKKEIRGKHSGMRQAFNDYHLGNLIIDKQGNSLLIAEERYLDAQHVQHFDNLVLFELNAAGELVKLRRITKEEGGDLASMFMSYFIVNTGSELHFLMNKSHRVFRFLNNYVYLPTDYLYGADKQLKELPVLRDLDNKLQWAPRFGVQVSRNEAVIPCVLGSSLLFGKITY